MVARLLMGGVARIHISRICDVHINTVHRMRCFLEAAGGQVPRVINPVKVGQRYGWLVVTKRDGRFAECICDCGNEARKSATLLNKGLTRSCGCLVDHYLKRRPTRKTPTEYQLRGRQSLSDNYVKNVLQHEIHQISGKRIQRRDIPPTVVVARRELITARRLFREMQRNDQT